MKLRTPLALTGAAALAVTTGLVTTANPSNAAATKSFAYGVSINGEGKQPYIESTDGTTQTQGSPAFPAEFKPLIDGTIAELSAGNDAASITIADVTVGDIGSEVPSDAKEQLAQLKAACEPLDPANEITDGANEALTNLEAILPPALVPELADVTELCNTILGFELPALADLDTLVVECNGDSGGVTLAGADILGQSVVVPGNIEPDTKLVGDSELEPLAAVVEITLNRQTKRPDGSFSVDGAVVSIGGGQGEIILGHTTCGEPIAQPAPRPRVNQPAPPAEAPEPVRQAVPVTG